MVFDPKVYRNNKDGIGGPGDPAATTSTEDSTLVSINKGIFHAIAETGVVVLGGATAAKQDTGNVSLASMDAKLTTLNFSTDTLESALGIVTETAPATDTASSGLNGRLQRIAQNLHAGAANIAKAEDAASADADVGVPSMAVRKATPANTSGTDGDYEMLQMSAGRLWVDASGVSLTVGTHAVTLAAGAAAIAKAEDVASADADVGVPAMAVQKATPANTAGTDGDYEFLQMSGGRLWASAVVTAAATSIGKAEDAASADADVGVPALAVRKATPANTSGTDGDYEFLQMSAGRLWASATIDAALPAGSNLIGRAVADASAATGGIASTARLLSAAASTNATNVKGSAGRVYCIQGHNAAAAFRYLKLYNKATSPTVGTDTPVRTIALPPGASFVLDFPLGYSFATGIGYGLTTAAADADTGALTAGDVICLNIDYV
ncbi:MAG: hypothetical protein LC750_00500 [Actinobacteria bacterium]|nr:hypothetical protein [Actinomycetota bacterium]